VRKHNVRRGKIGKASFFILRAKCPLGII